MSKHDEPNEYGFAGDPTAPEPPPKGQVDEQDRVEEVAVPGDDITESVSEALYEETDDEHAADRRH
ncbi:hypothetical protein [Micromonospora sp. WMMD812]|uniref:hypothetical protein n=1 Tax=Micromonospora sp. WMMD812 TaxID=3015152 RepID=UPI00248C588C|nr:hypothetical protein [Micromonospora sp. WMMD812]WBB68972.1 hypothetical protein O7603_06340 [Micromonospora sp. WMMD812]